MSESAQGESQSFQDALQADTSCTDDITIDIKYEIGGINTELDPEQISTDFFPGLQDSVHSAQKPHNENDVESNSQECERNCETSQMHIPKLREHVRATHEFGGQPIRDPVHIEIPYVTDNDHSSSNPQIKCEVEEVESMDSESDAQIMFCAGEINYTESVSDDRRTRDRKSDPQYLQKRPIFSTEEKDPLNTETADRNFFGSDPKSTSQGLSKVPFQTYSRKKKLCDPGSSTTLKRETTELPLPFPCGTCDKSYSSMDELNAHIRIIHGGDERIIYVYAGGKQFECEECGKRYATEMSLTDHKRIHTGEGLLKCDECDKVFTIKKSFTQHKKFHSGEGMLKCDECGRTFRGSVCLIVHKRTHTRYKCKVCQKIFIKPDELTRHEKIH